MDIQRQASTSLPNSSGRQSVATPRALDTLSNARMIEPQPHVLIERLRNEDPRDEKESISQIAGLLADMGNPVSRSLLIDAFRLDDLPQFKFEGAREKVFEALRAFNSESDVVSVCVEEFQVHPHSKRCCDAAAAALEGVEFSKFPKAQAICREIIKERSTGLKEDEECPGLSAAISAMRHFPGKELEKILVDSAVTAFNERRSGEKEIGLLARLGTRKAVAILSKIAKKELRPSGKALDYDAAEIERHFTRCMGYAHPAQVIGLIGGGAWGLMSSIQHFLMSDYGFAYICLGLIGGAVSGFAAVAAGSVLITNWVIRNRVKSTWNEMMPEEALNALCAMVPHPQAEEALAQIACSSRSGPSMDRATEALSRGASRASLEALKLGLESADEAYRMTCLNALAGRKEPEAEEWLGAMKADVDPDIRKRATKLLQERGRE